MLYFKGRDGHKKLYIATAPALTLQSCTNRRPSSPHSIHPRSPIPLRFGSGDLVASVFCYLPKATIAALFFRSRILLYQLTERLEMDQDQADTRVTRENVTRCNRHYELMPEIASLLLALADCCLELANHSTAAYALECIPIGSK